MEYSHRYHAFPTKEVAEGLEHHLNVHRQLYNHVRWDYTTSPEDDKPSELDQNNKLPGWKQRWPVITLLEYKADLHGTHVVQVEARGTTKECASCGVETTKPIWVREHSCPACGFKTDRDANAAMNVLKRGFSELRLGWPESTPVKTVTATDTTDFQRVSASHVIETGSLSS